MATLGNIQAKIVKLQAQAEALAANQSSGAIAKIRDIMETHGLTTADIDAHIGNGRKRGSKPSAKVAGKPTSGAAKYQDPKTGATWTGHGRAPAWIENAKDRAKFLIDGSNSAAVNVGAASKSKSAAKAAGKTTAKGKLPPKYRNPKIGETWSGHARPPAWINDVKDRTKFLIEGAGEGLVEPKATAVKKAATKKETLKLATATQVATEKVTAKRALRANAATKKAAVKKARPAAAKKAPKKVGAEKPPATTVTAA
jgi:DNA-binding protein H-NS